MTRTKRFSVTLDAELLDEAVRETGADSQREAIEEALRELLRRRALDRMTRRAGTIDLKLSVKDLLEDRDAEREVG